MSRLILIRHAESSPDPQLPEYSWPLTDQGARQARDLIHELSSFEISSFYSSPFVRAVDTVQPLADALGVSITIKDGLKERHLSNGMIDNWHELVRESWNDFGFALPGCESAFDCQQRIRKCIETIAAAKSGKTRVISSHGNAIALFLSTIDRTFGFEQWQAMQNPQVFHIAYADGQWSYST